MPQRVDIEFSGVAQMDLDNLFESIASVSKSVELAENYTYEMQLYIRRTLEFMPGMFAASEYNSVRRFGKYAIQFRGYTIIYNIADGTVDIMPSQMVIRGV